MTTLIQTSDTSVPLAQTLPGYDPTPTIDALNVGLTDYLNQPVRDILERLGLTMQPTPPDNAAPPDSAGAQMPPPMGSRSQPPSAPSDDGPDASGGSDSPIDPAQMIKPVTDALGMLGSGEFGDADPVGMFDGIGKAMDDAGGSLTQALSGMDGEWQGDAATAAKTATRDAMRDGAEVSTQAQKLRMSLMTATVAVQQAQTRLMEIVEEFWATIAAIGPSIIFPWGIAAAIAAAMKAVTEACEVMVETQGTMAAATARVFDDGAPVNIANSALLKASAPGAGSPLLPVASDLASPLLQSVNTLSGQRSGSTAGADPYTDVAHVRTLPDPPHASGTPSAAGGGGGPAQGGGGSVARPSVARLASQPQGSATPPATDDTVGRAAVPSAGASTGAPMTGGAPMGAHAGAGAEGKHTAASYLHTAGQGQQIVGESRSVVPPVVGEIATTNSPDIELRI